MLTTEFLTWEGMYSALEESSQASWRIVDHTFPGCWALKDRESTAKTINT